MTLIDKVSHGAAQAFFVAVFPAFFFYHLGAALDWYPMSFGAWWSPWNAAAAVVLSPLVVLHARIHPAKAMTAFILLVVLVAAYAVFHFLWGQIWQTGMTPLEESLKLIVGWVGLFSVAYFLVPNGVFGWAIWALWAAMTVVTFVLADPVSLSFQVREMYNAPEVATYQWFGQAYVVSAIVALAFAPHAWARRFVVGASLPIAFLLSSRADLVGLLAVVALWILERVLAKRWRDVLMAVAAGVLVCSAYALIGAFEGGSSLHPPGQAIGEVNRQLELLQPGKSESVVERLDLLRAGIVSIWQSPLFGDYAGQMRTGEGFGGYIHNALSAWHNYGLVTFVLFVGLSIWAGWVAFINSWRTDDEAWSMALYISVYAIVLIVLAKSVYWPVPALAWGYVVGMNARAARRNQRLATASGESPSDLAAFGGN